MATAGKPLGAIARLYTALQNRIYTPPTNLITGVDPKNFPSALQPVQPIGPPGSKPLAFSFWQGANQQITPRPDAALTFADLRDLATYDLARMCIENVKDQLCTLKWNIQLKEQPGQSVKDRKASNLNDQNIPKLTEFFSYPDGETPWSDWLRPLIEDLLVIDAPSIIVERTLKGYVGRLRVIDGTQILKLIDDQGYTPQGDSPAYTQLWEGIPRILLTTKQLVYRPSNIVPRNTLSSKLYGMSITEQVAEDIRIGSARLASTLLFYTRGSVPGVIHVVPSGVTADRFEEIQRKMNSELAGNLDKLREYRYVQGFRDAQDPGQDQIVQLKEPVLADLFDDLHIRKVAFAYGTSAQRLQKTLNRASAEAGQDASEKEGLMPRVKWLKGTLDLIIQRQMGYANYEWVVDTNSETDPVKQANVDKIYVDSGVKVINEVREKLGLDALSQPEASAPMIITATGAVPLEGSIDRTNTQHQADILPKPAPVIASKKKVLKSDIATEVVLRTDRMTTRNERLTKNVAATIAKFFKYQGKSVASQVGKAYKGATKKSMPFPLNGIAPEDETDDERRQRHELEAAILLANVKFGWDGLDLSYELGEAAYEGANLAEGDFPDANVDEYVEQAAQQYATARAAEMIGMKRNAKGDLVENKNAKWAISRTTHDDLVNTIAQAREEEWTASQLAAVIEASTMFSSRRAQLIAQTEMQNAQSLGTYTFWLASTQVQTVQWVTSGEENVCPVCRAFEDQGEVPLGHEFSPGIKYPTAHPACNCSLESVKTKGSE